MTEIEQYHPTQTLTVANSGANRIREAAEVMALCKQLADAVCNTGMMPKHLRGKPEETAAVMLYGATLDLDPMQSVRSIYEVHGQPGLYARAMVALVVGRGHEVWTVETSDVSVTVAGRRRGAANIETSTWTIERATKAGYVPIIDPDTGKYRLNKWGKLDGNEKYLTDPQSMLYAKAASEVCRKVAPDVLAGVYSVEDLQSERWDAEVVSVQRTAPTGLAAALAPSGAAPDHQGDTAAPEGPDATGEQAPAGDGGSVERGAGQTPLAAPPSESPLLNTGGRLAKRMFALFGELNITDKANRLVYVSDVVGREVTTSKEMTDADAEAVIASLEKDKPVDAEVLPDPTDPEDPWANQSGADS